MPSASRPPTASSVVLRHSRIYILPTRRGLALMVTLALMLLTSLNYALSLGLVVTFVVTGLVAAALLHTFRNLAGMEVKPLAAGDTFAGGKIAFSLALVARRRRRASRSTCGAHGARLLADVPAGEARTVSLNVAAPRARPRRARPRHAVVVVSARAVERLGLRALPARRARVSRARAVAAAAAVRRRRRRRRAQRHARDDADLAGLRDYQPGDPPQRVAWKAVARGAGWYTKQFEGAGGGPVVLDWRALPPELDVEARLSRLSAWVLGAERAARPFALSLPGYPLPASQGREHRRAALTALALFPRVSADERDAAPSRPHGCTTKARSMPLKPPQIRWLGALLLAAQVPQAVHLPIWVALFGAMLVALRFALLRRDRARTQRAASAHPVVGARAVRDRHRRRDPPVLRLLPRPRSVRRVPVRARRHQVPRGAHAARRHAARVPRAGADRHAVLLRPVDARRLRHHAGAAADGRHAAMRWRGRARRISSSTRGAARCAARS